MKYKVDVVRIRENSITLNGWALGKTPESKVTFRVEDEHHQPVKCKMVSTRRDDVSQIYFKKVIDKEFGFDIQFPYERGKSYWLLIRCDGRQAKIKYNEELITKRASVAHKRMEKIKDLMNMETVHVALDFWKENGLRALIKKSCHKIQGLDNDYDYGEWYELTKPTEEELKAQRETHFETFIFRSHTGIQNTGALSERDVRLHPGPDLWKLGSMYCRWKPQRPGCGKGIKEICTERLPDPL
jgi:hypothetical protein